MNNTGDTLVKMMIPISFWEWKFTIAAQFKNYKKVIYDTPNSDENPWFFFLDLVAMHWGYYGDLDIHIDAFEIKLKEKLDLMQTREDINAFVREIGESYDEREKNIENLKKTFGVHEVIQI